MNVCFKLDCCEVCYTYLDGFLDNDINIVDLPEADVVCFIGCGYTYKSMHTGLQNLCDIINNKKPSAKVAVFGCPTEYSVFCDTLKKFPDIDYIGRGTGLKMQQEIASYLERQLAKPIDVSGIGAMIYGNRINVVVQDGCNNRCAFCKSNYLNLKLQSRPIDEIIELIKFASEELNVKEVNITGLNPTQYGMDLYKSQRLTDIIQQVSAIDSVESILVDMLCVSDMKSDLITEIVTNPKIKRVMIPVQSQDDRLLKLMGRKNTAEQAEKIFSIIHKERPDIFLETIFLICYPTETFDNAKKSVEFMQKYNISNPNISIYEYGKNVKSLKSENIVKMTDEEHNELLEYYIDNVLPVIDMRRDYLLQKPVVGTLINRDDEFDYYSTLYRFTTNEYKVKAPRNEDKHIFDKSVLSVDYLPALEDVVYVTKDDYGNGIVMQ